MDKQLLAVILITTALPLKAQIASDFGTVGLLDMPSARMKSDSDFWVSIATQDIADTYSFNYQALPWLEASFRYIIQDPSNSFGATAGTRDRSYGIKLRLNNESKYLPEFAVGLQDAVGTGVYGAEYIVGSKQLTNNLDVTLGVGWGRLANREAFSNPLRTVSSRFDARTADTGLGGEARTSDYFSGADVGVFGGFEYQLPVKNVTFLAEYNSDEYRREVSGGFAEIASPFSFGLNWQINENNSLAFSWQHGNEIGLRYSASASSNALVERKSDIVPYYRLQVLAEDEEALGAEEWYEKLAIDVDGASLKLRAARLSENGKLASLGIENTGYMLQARVIADVVRMAARFLPESVERLSVTVFETGLYPITLDVPVSLLRERGSSYSNQYLHRLVKIKPGNRLQNADYRSEPELGRLVFTGDLANSLSLFDPISPLLYQIYLNAGVSMRLPADIRLYAAKRIAIDDNFDSTPRGVSDSVLPHVRSDHVLYLREGTNGIDRLYLNKYGKLGSEVYYRAFAGLLERMFGGVGGELLYQPYRSRFAYGFSAIAVKQREFEQKFGFQDYETIVSHASIYWSTPWSNYDLAIHAGRYLGKDVGATFELTRRFSNGWEIGLFATFTDVSAEDFGEGSFDKGFRIRIPLELVSGRNSRARLSSDIRPIGRDGGARLGTFSAGLWDKLRPSNYDSVYDNLGELVK